MDKIYPPIAYITCLFGAIKICKGSNETICSPGTSSRQGKDARIKIQGYERDDTLAILYFSDAWRRNGDLETLFLN